MFIKDLADIKKEDKGLRVLHTESSKNWGGQEYRTLLEHEYLNKNGHTSYIACGEDSELYKRAKARGSINIIPIDFSKPYRIGSAIKLLKFCKKNRIDIINTHGSKDSTLSLLAFAAGIPLIRSRQISSDVKKKFSYQYTCTHVIAAAQAIKDILIAKGVDANKITVIGEGVDLDEYNPDIDSGYLREEFDIKKDDIVITNIGMIRGDKGQRYFLEAAKKVLREFDNVKFFLIGEGTQDKKLEKELREEVSKASISEKFIMTGYRNDVNHFIHLSDFVVISSTGVEAQSRIVPQAFASKRTVVSTDTGGLTELVSHNVNGLVVPKADSEQMYKAMKVLISDKELRRKLASNAYEFALKDLSFEKMMKKTIELYRSFVD